MSDKVFKMRIKTRSGAEFEYEESTDYPLISTNPDDRHSKDHKILVDNIRTIVGVLERDNES